MNKVVARVKFSPHFMLMSKRFCITSLALPFIYTYPLSCNYMQKVAMFLQKPFSRTSSVLVGRLQSYNTQTPLPKYHMHKLYAEMCSRGKYKHCMQQELIL